MGESFDNIHALADSIRGALKRQQREGAERGVGQGAWQSSGRELLSSPASRMGGERERGEDDKR